MVEPRVTTSMTLPVSVWMYAKRRKLKVGVVAEAAIRAMMKGDATLNDPEPEYVSEEDLKAELDKLDDGLPADAPHGDEERRDFAAWYGPYVTSLNEGRFVDPIRPTKEELWRKWRESRQVPSGATGS